MAFIAGFTVLRDASGNITDYINGSFPDCVTNECNYGLHNDFQVKNNRLFES